MRPTPPSPTSHRFAIFADQQKQTQPLAGMTYTQLWVWSRDEVAAPVDESFTSGSTEVLTVYSASAEESIDVSILGALSGGQARLIPAGSLTMCDGDTVTWEAGWDVVFD